MPTEKYTASGPLGVCLSRNQASRESRAHTALRSFLPADMWPDAVTLTGQASTSVVRVGGLRVLVSYVTVVAYGLPDGSYVATPRNYYSRTTQRSIDDFCRHPVQLEPVAFGEALKRHLGNVAGAA